MPFHVAGLQTVQWHHDRVCLDPILFCFYRIGVRRRREDGGSAQRKGDRIGVVPCLKSMFWKLNPTFVKPILITDLGYSNYACAPPPRLQGLEAGGP